MKKYGVFSFALIFALLMPSIAFASEGEPQLMEAGWQYKGSQGLAVLDTSGPFKTDPFESQGGDYQFRISDISLDYPVSVWEYDPNGGDDRVTSTLYKSGNSYITLRDINNYLDGSDGDAEFYLKFGTASGSNYRVLVEAYD